MTARLAWPRRVSKQATGTGAQWYRLARRLVMPKSISVTLDERLVGFIERQIAAGRSGSASEVVRAALEIWRSTRRSSSRCAAR